MNTFSQAILLGLGLTILSQLVSTIAGIVLGGFTVGRLERAVDLILPSAEREAFQARLLFRLNQLGFRAGARPEEFVQSGATLGDLSSFTHAKVPKRLDCQATTQGAQVRLRIRLQYLSAIVGDTGESAYAGAVLDYVTGKADAMTVVSNRLQLAFSALVGGVLGVVAAALLAQAGLDPVEQIIGMVVFTGTNVVCGAMAVATIRANPKELWGTRDAVLGMVLSVVGLVVVVAWELGGR